jgi:hypothetical protein
MCNCSRLPTSVADIEYWQQGFASFGASINARYFEIPDSECYEPILQYSIHLYKCIECGQPWYIECLPEETPSPGFALKLNDPSYSPSDEEVNAAKEYLCVLAHGGFSPHKCRMSGCNNHQLLGRELCHLHITFP